jgi:hypothetical protein
MGGVESTPLQTGTEMIAARGNAFTDSMKVQQFVLLKAAEDCLSSGYQKFAFTSVQDVSKSGAIVLPGQTHSNSTVTGFGNTATVTTNSYSTPPTVIPTIKPGTDVIVKFYKANEPAPSNALDARQIANNLGPRLEN